MLPFLLSLLGEDSDRQTFERIYLAYRAQMFAVARAYLPSDADAEDAVHDVFVRVASRYWERVCAIENDTDLRNYLLKAAKHTALNMLERRAAKDLSLDDAVSAGEFEAETDDDTFVSACARLEEARLVEAIRELPDIYRDALYYRYVLQFSVSETARAMRQSVAATKKQIQRGKQKLLALLRE